MFTAVLIFFVVGILAGLLAGLVGGGGGVIVVPLLVYTLPLFGITEHIHHLALGTSLASILFTTLSGVRAHNKRETVLWSVVGHFTPGIVIGTFAGGVVASRLETKPLTVVFLCFLAYVIYTIFFDIKPAPTRRLPSQAALWGVGLVIGLVSSFVGIGGGALTVPFLLMCNVPIRNAIGTSAGITIPIALSGAISFAVNGWNVPGLPPYSLGFIYVPALIGIASASIFAAPLGASLGYRLSTSKVRKCFGCFLFLVACNMLYRVLS